MSAEVDELVAFLRTRLDEDEQTAMGATWAEDASAWRAHHREQYDGKWAIIDSLDDRVTEVNAEASDDAGVATHIARHDPERVLREVEAKRKVIDETVEILGDMEERINSEWGFTGEPLVESGKLLRLLALPYADEPGYRQEWRP